MTEDETRAPLVGRAQASALKHHKEPPPMARARTKSATQTERVAAADALLDPALADANERTICSRIARLLTSFGIEVEEEYPSNGHRIDLFLPRRRTIIEVKRRTALADVHRRQGAGQRSAYQQLDQYARNERDRDLQQGDLFDEDDDAPWLAILSDGAHWHAWHYPHARSAPPEPVEGWSPRLTPTRTALLDVAQRLRAQTPIGKPWVPSNPHPLFEKDQRKLVKIRRALLPTFEHELHTKQTLWMNMLRMSGMAPENALERELQFLDHTLLITIARGVTHTLTAPRETPNAKRLLGEGFVAWVWENALGQQWAEEVLEKVHAHDWRRRQGDVLRSLYESLIAPEQRKVFGEYYTPDWLATLLVGATLDERWCSESARAARHARRTGKPLTRRGVLDPSCGSGTFLYHAARRLLDSRALARHADNPREKADVVAALVHGLDVHPVAVEIARATVLRALPASPTQGARAIQIHQGDALIAHDATPRDAEQVAQDDLFHHDPVSFHFHTPHGNEITLARSLAQQHDFAQRIEAVVERAKTDLERHGRMRPASNTEKKEPALAALGDVIRKVIDEEGNAIWAWYIINMTAPLRTSARKVDRLIGNPPWITLREVQHQERKTLLEQCTRHEGLWSGNARQAPHHNVAQLFVKRARGLYLHQPERDPAAWVLPHVAHTTETWRALREAHEPHVSQILDLRATRAFGAGEGSECLAWLEHARCAQWPDEEDEHMVLEPLEDPKANADEIVQTLRGRRGPRPFTRKASAYRDDGIHQGAKITPDVLTRVEKASRTGEDRTRITTRRSTKEPWKQIAPLTGTVPAHWVRPYHAPHHLLPFAIREPLDEAIIPSAADGLITEPGRNNRFAAEAQALYHRYRGTGKSNPHTVMQRLDFGGNLSRQLTRSPDPRRRTVLYPASRSKRFRSARVACTDALVESTLYWMEMTTEDEAAYLVALLNAPALLPAFNAAKQSPRHFDKHIWRTVPIPRYDARDPVHQALAALCRKAEGIAGHAPAELTQVVQALETANIFDALDALAAQVLPEHAKPG